MKKTRCHISKVVIALLVILAIAAEFVVITSVVFNFGKLDYKIDSYSYTSVKDDPSIWAEFDFDLSDKEKLDILHNPEMYYVISIDGTLYNNHKYNVYNWRMTENFRSGIANDYWLDSSPIEATFPMEPSSDFFTISRILVKCQKNEIEQICKRIAEEERLVGRGQIIVTSMV